MQTSYRKTSLFITWITIIMMAPGCTPTPLHWDPDVAYKMVPVEPEEIHSQRFGENARFQMELHDGTVFTFRLASFPDIHSEEHLAGIDEVSKDVVILSRDEIKEAQFITMVRADYEPRERDGGGGGASEALFWMIFAPVAAVSMPAIEAHEKAKQRQREKALARIMVDYELQAIRRARAALAQHDAEKAYRLLEDGVVSEYPEVQEKVRDFIEEHPEVLEGARRSFSPENLRQSIATHAANARELEGKRLSIYKIVASDQDYESARLTVDSVLADTNQWPVQSP